MLASPLLPSFLDTYSLCHFGCKTLCIIFDFCDLWSICLGSFLVHFKNCLVYLTRGTYLRVDSTDKISTTELGFEKYSRSFAVLFLTFSFNFFLFEYFQILEIFFFSKSSDVFLIWNFDSFRCLSFPLFSLWAWHTFQCQIPFLYLGGIFL